MSSKQIKLLCKILKCTELIYLGGILHAAYRSKDIPTSKEHVGTSWYSIKDR